MGKRQKLAQKRVRKLSDGSKIVEHIYKDLRDGKARGYVQRFKNGKRVHSNKFIGKDDIAISKKLSDYYNAFLNKSNLKPASIGKKFLEYVDNIGDTPWNKFSGSKKDRARANKFRRKSKKFQRRKDRDERKRFKRSKKRSKD